jgi:hypothetical protein
MGTITLTEAEVGQSVAKDQVIKGLKLKVPPSAAGYGQYFTLVDATRGDFVLYNFDPSTSYVGTESALFAGRGQNIPDLTLKSIPAGSTFELETDNPPPPPALTSLSPDTAVSGDPDLTLICTGTGFTDTSVIMFGTEDEPTTYVSDTELTTVVKPSLFAPATVPVTVRTDGVPTDPVDFTFTEPAAKEA